MLTLTVMAGLVGWVSPASATGGQIAVLVDVQHASIGGQGGNGCWWDITTTTTFVNLSSQPATISALAGNVSFQGPPYNGVTNVQTILAPGAVGTVLQPDQRLVQPLEAWTDAIPCSAVWADLAVVVTDGNRGMSSGDAVFLGSGTAVPMFGVGAAAGVGLLATGFAVSQSRSRRRRRAVADAGPVRVATGASP